LEFSTGLHGALAWDIPEFTYFGIALPQESQRKKNKDKEYLSSASVRHSGQVLCKHKAETSCLLWPVPQSCMGTDLPAEIAAAVKFHECGYFSPFLLDAQRMSPYLEAIWCL